MEIEILKAHEAAHFLKLNEQTVRRLARSGELPGFRVGGSWRFKRSTLSEWAEGQSESPSGQRILVVDDEESVRKVVRRVLQEEGYQVVTAAGGREALAEIEREIPDLVFLDLKMPEMDGPQVLKAVKAKWSFLPVVILTAYPESDMMAKVLEFSPLIILEKPSDPEKIVEAAKKGILLGNY